MNDSQTHIHLHSTLNLLNFASTSLGLFTKAFSGTPYRETFTLLMGSHSGAQMIVDDIILIPNLSRSPHRLRLDKKLLINSIETAGERLIATAHTHSEVPCPSATDSNLFSMFPRHIVHLIIKPEKGVLSIFAYTFLGSQTIPCNKVSI